MLEFSITVLCPFTDGTASSQCESSTSFPVAMVISLLAAMQNNDMEARQRFPRLLQIVAAHPDTVNTFMTKVWGQLPEY